MGALGLAFLKDGGLVVLTYGGVARYRPPHFRAMESRWPLRGIEGPRMVFAAGADGAMLAVGGSDKVEVWRGDAPGGDHLGWDIEAGAGPWPSSRAGPGWPRPGTRPAPSGFTRRTPRTGTAAPTCCGGTWRRCVVRTSATTESGWPPGTKRAPSGSGTPGGTWVAFDALATAA